MVERFGSVSLLAVATVLFFALLGLGSGVACDRDVRADESNAGGAPATVDPRAPGDETNPVGGGPIEQAAEQADEDADGVIDHSNSPGEDMVSPGPNSMPADPAPKGSVQDKLRPDSQPPQPSDLGEDDGAGQPQPINRPEDEDSSSSPGGNGTGEEDAPDEENWGAPVRGSGGDEPPDYIVPSDPKQV